MESEPNIIEQRKERAIKEIRNLADKAEKVKSLLSDSRLDWLEGVLTDLDSALDVESEEK